jgi:hypothetical protein
MTYYYGEYENFDVDYDFKSDVEMDFDTKNDYDSYVYVDHYIWSDTYIDGNTVAWNVDAQAFGTDTLVDVNIVGIASDDYSSFTSSGVVATD